MKSKLQVIYQSIQRELLYYKRVMNDERSPRIAKVFLWIAIAYTVNPIDLVPDWIPLLGWLDELVVVPLLIWFGMLFIPDDVKKELRKESRTSL